MRPVCSWVLSLGIALSFLPSCGSDDNDPAPAGAGGTGGQADAGGGDATQPDDAGGGDATQPDDAGGGDATQPDDAGGDATNQPEGGGGDGGQPDATDDATVQADGMDEAQADAPQETGPEDAAADAAEAGLDASSKAQLLLSFNHDWIWTDVERDTVTVQCTLVDAQGVAQPAPADLVISVAEATAIKKSAASWSFPGAGAYPVVCASSSLGMTTSRDLVVAYEGFDYRYVKVVQALSEYDDVVRRIVEANVEGNVSAYQAAVSELEALGARIPTVTAIPFLVSNPNGWPTDQQLAGAGFTGGAQDADWLAKLESLRLAIVAERTVLSSLASPPTTTQVQALNGAYAETAARVQALSAVTPSGLAVWKNLSKIGALLSEMGETTRVRASVLAPLFKADPPLATDGGAKFVFSLVGTLASIAIGELVDAYSYQSILKDVGKVAVASMLSIAIKDLINAHLPVGAQAPVIDSIHGSAAGFCGPGNPFIAYGSFNQDYAKSRIIFIPPQLSMELAGIVDVVDGLNGITQEDNILKLVNNIRKVLEDLVSVYQAAWGANEQFLSLTPSSGDDMFLNYPALPYGINCNQFQLPVAGTMIPLDFDYGRGLAINVNVLGEPVSHCP